MTRRWAHLPERLHAQVAANSPARSVPASTTTDALTEHLLLQLLGAGLPCPERELALIPGRRWRCDLGWPARRLVVEIEGGVARYPGQVQGHTRPERFDSDCRKYNALATAGWCVIRVTGRMIANGEALVDIEDAYHRELS